MPVRLFPGQRGGAFTPTTPNGVMAVGAISTITDDTKYDAWPVVTKLANGNLFLVYTKGDSHHQDNTGKAVSRTSSDNGATWAAEVDVYDHATLWVTAMGVMQTSSGRVIVTLWRDSYGVSGSGEAGIVYSDSNGGAGTWSAWIALSNGFTREAYGAGPALGVGSNLLITIEGSNTAQSVANRSSHTLKSTDDGATWGSEVTVRNYVTDTRPYYESKLVKLGSGTLLCVHRTSAGTGTHYISTSSDSGLTWGAPASAFAGYGAPSTTLLSTATLIAITRRNSDAACIAYASITSGSTWLTAVVLDATMTEMEYGCAVELNDGRVLVVYGSQPSASTTNADIKQVYLTEGRS